MASFSQLNKLENDHPLPLMYYYRSYVQQGKAPPENAKKALEHASELAPFDKSLLMNVGLMQAREGKIALAKRSLAPLAADPHGGRAAERVKALIAILDKIPEGQPFRRPM